MNTDLLDTTSTALHQHIKNRQSKRAYRTDALSNEQIRILFEAARWAPSANNEQPWSYVFATKDQPELWQKIFDALNDTNKIWAEHAPVLVVAMIRKNFERTGLPNGSARYDLGAANALLSIQAESMGLNVHQMGGYNKAKAIENLNIPDTHEPVVVMAIGYPGAPEILPEHLRQREIGPRTRSAIDTFVMNKTF